MHAFESDSAALQKPGSLTDICLAMACCYLCKCTLCCTNKKQTACEYCNEMLAMPAYRDGLCQAAPDNVGWQVVYS